MDDRSFRLVETLFKVGTMKFIHEKADRPLLHAVDRLVLANEAVERLQHEAIAAKCDDNIGCFRVHGAVAGDQAGLRRIRLRGAGGQKSYSFEAVLCAFVWLHAEMLRPQDTDIAASRAAVKPSFS